MSKEDWEMRITKDVAQPFLITSKEVLKLIRTGKCKINLPDEIGFKLEINDEVEE